MASSDPVVEVLEILPPSGSTPAEGRARTPLSRRGDRPLDPEVFRASALRRVADQEAVV